MGVKTFVVNKVLLLAQISETNQTACTRKNPSNAPIRLSGFAVCLTYKQLTYMSEYAVFYERTTAVSHSYYSAPTVRHVQHLMRPNHGSQIDAVTFADARST